MPVRRLRFGLTLATACAVLALGAGQAAAAPAFFTSVSKHKGGPFTESVQSVSIPPGATKTLYWKVRSNGGNPPPYELSFDDGITKDPNPPGFKIKWFRKDRNITSEVKGPGYEFKVDTEHPKVFRAQVRAVDEGSFCLAGRAYFTEGTPAADSAYFGVNGDTCSG